MVSSSVVVLGPLLGAYNSFKTIKARSVLLRRAATAADAAATASAPRHTNSSSFFRASHRAPAAAQTSEASPAPDPELVAAFELNRKDTLDMLMYWVAFAVLITFTRFVQPFVFWVPFYEYAKLCAVVFIAVPDTKGSRFIFETAIAPTVDTYEGAFLAKVWPKLQARMLSVAQQCEAAVLENSVAEVSAEELEKCERDMQVLKLECKKERSKRRSLHEESRGSSI